MLLCNKGQPEVNEMVAKWIIPIKWKAIFSFDLNYGAKESLYSQLLNTDELLRSVQPFFTFEQ